MKWGAKRLKEQRNLNIFTSCRGSVLQALEVGKFINDLWDLINFERNGGKNIII